MTGHLLQFKKTVTIVFIVLFSTVGIQSSYADYYPNGIEQNVSEQTLLLGGWTLRYEQTYSTVNSSTGSEFRPSEKFMIVTGKSIGSNVLTTVAAAPTNSVFTSTTIDTPQLLNGTYWYYTPTKSFGYSPTNVIEQNSADITGCDFDAERAVACASNPSRLSWHLAGDITAGGYRLGNAGWINNDGLGGNSYLKQVWSWDGPVSRKTANLTFKDSITASDILSDWDGQLRATVDQIMNKYGSLIK
jgi:hypothetical protein